MKDVLVLSAYKKKEDATMPNYIVPSGTPAIWPQTFYEISHKGGHDNHNLYLYMQYIPTLKAGTKIIVYTSTYAKQNMV